ncbi:putative pentatricopeptide repeat-containing protein At3g13770, mitochondrial [Wolffia australiana]
MASSSLRDLLRRCDTLLHAQALHAAASKRGLLSAHTPLSAALLAAYCARRAPPSTALHLFHDLPSPPPPRSWNAAISALFRAAHCTAAHSLFDEMPSRTPVSWAAAVAGNAQNCRPARALLVFRAMAPLDTTPQSLSAAIAAATALLDRRLVALLHARAAKLGLHDPFVGSALVHAYGSSADLPLARQVFDEMPHPCVVAWSSLMGSFLRQGRPSLALALFREMVCTGAVAPNEFTLATALSACARVQDLAAGEQLHAFVIRRRGRVPDVFVSSALIDMYCKSGSLGRAAAVFELEFRALGKKGIPLWNTIIAGYAGGGRVRDAWGAVRAMGAAAVQPNAVTLAVVLPLCAAAGQLLRAGKEAHCFAIRMGLSREILVGNSLLDMYCKCGELSSAATVFDMMPERNRISWTAIINGHGRHGSAAEAVRLFRRMAAEPGIRPDEVTLVAVISACGHGGLVEEGLGLVKELTEVHGLVLTKEAHGAMVDLLARAGRLAEAARWAAMAPGKSALGALLSGCRIYGEVNRGESTARRLAAFEPDGTGFPSLLSSIYAENGMVDRAVGLRAAMSLKAHHKIRGCSWLETAVKQSNHFK